MAKSALPLLLGVGVVAVVMSGKKKRKASAEPDESGIGDPVRTPADEAARSGMEMNDECSKILASVGTDEHDRWLTNRYEQMVAGGEGDLAVISLNLLKEQSEHCPWDNPDAWTRLMGELYSQVFEGVKEYHMLRKLPQG